MRIPQDVIEAMGPGFEEAVQKRANAKLAELAGGTVDITKDVPPPPPPPTPPAQSAADKAGMPVGHNKVRLPASTIGVRG